MNETLVAIANGFHKELMFQLGYDLGGSLADEVENILVKVLNEHTEGRIKWAGLGTGYVIEEGK